MLQRLELVLLCIALLFACGRQDWARFRSDDGSFSIDMPGKPEQAVHDSRTQVGPIQLKTYTVRAGNGSVYLVAHNQYPEAVLKASTPNALLESVVSGAVDQGKLRKKTTIDILNYPGREVLADVKGGLEYRSRFYLVDERLYQISVLNKPGQVSNQDKQKFLDSFQLLEARSAK
jgi:hypothetical protein